MDWRQVIKQADHVESLCIRPRRDFIKQIVLLLGATTVGEPLYAHDAVTDGDDGSVVWLNLIEPDALVDVRIGLVGLQVRKASLCDRYDLVEPARNDRSLLLIELPPQHLYEEAFIETTAHEVPPDIGEVNAVYSHRTVLAFQLKGQRDHRGERRIALSLNELLDWERNLELVQADFSKSGGPPWNRTAIELPSGLLLGISDTAWRWRSRIDADRDYTELWRAQILSSRDPRQTVEIRPFATADIRWNSALSPHSLPGCLPSKPGEFLSSLGREDREDIVATFSGRPAQQPDAAGCASPAAPTARLLALSSMGGWLSVEARHPNPEYGCGHQVGSWEHQVAYGGDDLARIEKPVVLYPYGFRAKVIQISERRMHKDSHGRVGAFLRREYFIERVPDDVVQNDQLDMPFDKLFVDLARTPPLDVNSVGAPCDAPQLAGSFDTAFPTVFWPTVGGLPFQFPLAGNDKTGAFHERFTSAVIVVPYEKIDAATGHILGPVLASIDAEWQKPQNLPRRTSIFFGAKLALAREGVSGETTLSTHSIEFVRSRDTAAKIGQKRPDRATSARAYRCEVEHPALSALTGDQRRVHASYRKNPSDPDAERQQPTASIHDPQQSEVGVYLQLIDTTDVVFSSYGADRCGAVATPGLVVGAISTRTGLVPQAHVASLSASSVSQLAIGDVFKGVDARLLGGPSLKDILANIFATTIEDLPALQLDLPEVDLAELYPDLIAPMGTGEEEGIVEPPSEPRKVIRSNLSWSYTWKDNSPPVLIFRPWRFVEGQANDSGHPATIALNVRSSLDVSTGQSTFGVDGSLKDFQIALPTASAGGSWITVAFDAVTFQARNGEKTRFSPVISGFAFENEFAFVNAVTAFLKNLGGTGVAVTVTPQNASITHSLTIPPFSIGAILVTNLRFIYGIAIPFDGSPLLTEVALSTRDDPCTVTVGGYAGGGFFRFLLGSDEPKALEVAIEFGGNYEANFGGIAKGKASLMAGIYYGLFVLDGHRNTILQGYVRAEGYLDVWSIGGINIVAYLRLTFSSDNGNARGAVAVTVSITIGFVRITQSFQAEHTIAGSGDTTHLLEPHFVQAAKSVAQDAEVAFSDIFDSDPKSPNAWIRYLNCFHGD